MPPPLMPPLTRGRKQRAIRESPLQFVGNDLSVVPQNYIEIYGRARRPAPTTGRRVVAPYARNIFFRVVAGFHARPLFLPLTREVARRSRDGGRETEKSLPQSNALHLTAHSSEGAITAGASPRPTLILYFVRSKNTPTNPNLWKLHIPCYSISCSPASSAERSAPAAGRERVR